MGIILRYSLRYAGYCDNKIKCSPAYYRATNDVIMSTAIFLGKEIFNSYVGLCSIELTSQLFQAK